MKIAMRRASGISLAVALVAMTACGDDDRGPATEPTDAASLAPLVRIDGREDMLPMSAARFIASSGLEWGRGGSCAYGWDVTPSATAGADDPSPLPRLSAARLGADPGYRARPLDADCGPTSKGSTTGVAYSSSQHTRPYDTENRPAGLRFDEGFSLDVAKDVLHGERRLDDDGSLSVPAYLARERAGTAERPRIRLSYWMLFGAQIQQRPGRPNREGDWERVDVVVRPARGRLVPLTVEYRDGDRVRRVAWSDVEVADGTHPVVYLERGVHTPRPDRLCERCLDWPTWHKLRDVRREPWFGYGGGWGSLYRSDLTSGPSGPSPFVLGPAPAAGRIGGDTLTVFASLPRHGPSRGAAADAETGMRIALARARGRAAGRRIRFVPLSSTTAGTESWDRAAVAANARRAADDPTTVAYIGELELGGSTVSLPIVTRAGILQVSPADGMTSLGRSLPGDANDSSRRYSQDGRISFVRLVPPDLDSTRRIADSLVERRPRRLVVLEDEGVASRELARLVLFDVRAEISPRVRRVPVRGGARQVATAVRRTLTARPDAVLYAGAAGPAARAVLGALDSRLPRVPVVGGPPLASPASVPGAPAGACAWTGVPAPAQLPPRGRRLLARMRARANQPLSTYAVLGYAAMRLTLNAIATGGADRDLVVRAARSNVDHDEVAVGYGLGNRAHVEPIAVSCRALRRP